MISQLVHGEAMIHIWEIWLQGSFSYAICDVAHKTLFKIVPVFFALTVLSWKLYLSNIKNFPNLHLIYKFAKW